MPPSYRGRIKLTPNDWVRVVTLALESDPCCRLTGSANLLLLPRVQESLAGRIEVIYLHPLSEQEKQGGEKSLLQTLLSGEIKTRISSSAEVVQGIAEAICQGGGWQMT